MWCRCMFDQKRTALIHHNDRRRRRVIKLYFRRSLCASGRLIYKHKKNRKSALIGSLTGAAFMGIFSIVSNYFLVYPVYYNFMPEEVILAAYQAILPSVKNILQCLICFNMPFTIVKGMFSVVITFLTYKHISPILKGSQNR